MFKFLFISVKKVNEYRTALKYPSNNINKVRKTSILLLLVIVGHLLTSCGSNEHPPVAFYYWKQTFRLTKSQKEFLSTCGSTRMYVKFFDIVINDNNEVAPISKIEFNQTPSTEIIPCVFIQNAVFIGDRDVDALAKKMTELIQRIAQKNSLTFHEIQIDCDWTAGSRDNYFEFLKRLQKQVPKLTICCTVRLHQVKYQTKTGIPPVKKGLLMCYNMDDMVDTAGTLTKAAEVLKSRGAKKVIAYCTHPVLSGSAVERIAKSPLDELVVTDTIPLSKEAKALSKIRQLSCASLLAETIRRISKGDSVMSLFAEDEASSQD